MPKSSEYRFGPARYGQPATWLWKIWTSGSEIYLSCRSAGGISKISVHASGQIHCRIDGKKQDLAPLGQMGVWAWSHAIELRYLLSDDAFLPDEQRESLRNKTAILIDVPRESVLIVNLVISIASAPANAPLPNYLAGTILWRVRLRDGRLAVLIARVVEYGDENRRQLSYVRNELRPTVTLKEGSGNEYVEVIRLSWSGLGNFAYIVPMGTEAIRIESDDVHCSEMLSIAREFHYQQSRSTFNLIAPNGFLVAEVEWPEVNAAIELRPGNPETIYLGAVIVRLIAENFILGSAFKSKPYDFPCPPKVGGGSPRSWNYTVHSRFDGSQFTIEIAPLSTALRDDKARSSTDTLNRDEELVVAIPAHPLQITIPLNKPVSEMELSGRFTLRRRR